MNHEEAEAAIRATRRDVQITTEGHRMTVLRDDGLYRHLRFRSASGSSLYGFDLVTWPNYLTVTGDFGGFQFTTGVADMFEFFGSGVSCVEPGRINPGYWAEKVCAGRDSVRVHSPDDFRRQVVEYFMDNRHGFHPDRRELFTALRDFVLGGEAEDQFSAAVALFTFQHHTASGRRFEFGDYWEWDCTEWSWQYLRCLHAIVWGIGHYRQPRELAAIPL